MLKGLRLPSSLATFIAIALPLFGPSTFAKMTEVPNVRFVGASNTAGFGATYPMRTRLEAHLVENASPHQIQVINRGNFVISMDLFYPTRFPKLESSDAVSAAIEEIDLLIERERPKFLIISLLPELDRVPTSMREKVQKSQFRTLFKSLDNNRFRSGTQRVNKKLLELHRSRRNGTQIITVDPHVIFSADQFDDVPKKSLFRAYDGIHFNNRGQAYVLNLFVIDTIERVLRMKRGSIPRIDLETLPSTLTSSLYRAQREADLEALKAVDEAFARQEELLRQYPAPRL